MMIIDASPAALRRKSAGKRKNISEKATSSKHWIRWTKVIGHDCPDRELLLIRVLQVNHWDCMCTRQGARNWWRPACLNGTFACVIVSHHGQDEGAEHLRAENDNCSRAIVTRCLLRWELCALWWKRSLGTLWASLLTPGSRSALQLDWWQKELRGPIDGLLRRHKNSKLI